MLRSGLCDYSDAYILTKGTIAVTETTASASNNANKKVIFKNCAAIINFISRINSTQVDDAHDIQLVIPTYILIEYSDSYSKTFGILWRQYCKDEPAINANVGNTGNFNADNAINDSFKIKEKVTGQTVDNVKKNIEITVPFKYLSNFGKTLEVTLINCKINLDLN